jgi:3-deoxy-D-manno-octulosonic acid kinase
MKSDPGTLTIRSSTYHLDANAELLEVLERAGLTNADGFDAALRSARALAGGRGPQRLVELPGAAAPLRLREARRGGALGGLFSNRFRSPRRVGRELALWLALRGRGAPLPVPVAAFSRRRGLFWESHFGTLDRDESVDGLAWLRASPSRSALLEVAGALATALRRFHDAGGLHGDLNLRNVLIEGDAKGLRCWLIDLGSARLSRNAAPRARLQDWLRLERSLEKCGFARLLDPRLRARALAAYCAGDRRLRERLVAAYPGEQRRMFRHRLAWRFERACARG